MSTLRDYANALRSYHKLARNDRGAAALDDVYQRLSEADKATIAYMAPELIIANFAMPENMS